MEEKKNNNSQTGLERSDSDSKCQNVKNNKNKSLLNLILILSDCCVIDLHFIPQIYCWLQAQKQKKREKKTWNSSKHTFGALYRALFGFCIWCLLSEPVGQTLSCCADLVHHHVFVCASWNRKTLPFSVALPSLLSRSLLSKWVRLGGRSLIVPQPARGLRALLRLITLTVLATTRRQTNKPRLISSY